MPIGRRAIHLATAGLLATAVGLSACSSQGSAPTDAATSSSAQNTPTANLEVSSPSPSVSPAPNPCASRSPQATPSSTPTAVGRFPERVYVPNSKADTLTVIDPSTREVIATYDVGDVPHHVTPAWDLQSLAVDNTGSGTLSIIDPATGKITRTVQVDDPYNLYYTPDGRSAVVVAERLRRLDLRDPDTWELQRSIEGLPEGVDHGNFTHDGLFVVTSEFAGKVSKVDLEAGRVVGVADLGGKPVDVVRVPGTDEMLIANETLDGVHVFNPATMTEMKFIPTGNGTHGILLSRDADRVFVSNRLGGTISVIDLSSLTVTDTWNVGGSPDMGQLNPDGTEMWISNRYHGSVSVIDTATGKVLDVIPTGAGAHGLTYFPTVNRHSLGHNGVYVGR